MERLQAKFLLISIFIGKIRGALATLDTKRPNIINKDNVMPDNLLKVTCFLFILNFLICLDTIAQDKEVMVLLSQIEQAEHDTTKANLYNELAVYYHRDKPDEASRYAYQAYAIAHDADYLNAQARSLQIQGVIADYAGEYDKALSKSHQALRLYQKMGDQKKVYSILNNIGNLHSDRGEYEKSLEYYNQALQKAQKAKDQDIVAIILGNIGAVYTSQGDNIKNIQYTLQALKIYEELDDQEGIGISLNNLGISYIDLKDYENALKYLKRGLQVQRERQDERGVSTILSNIGHVYLERKNYYQSRKYYLQALNIQEKIQDEPGISTTLNNLGDTNFEMKKFEDALNYYNRALEIKKKIGDPHGEVYSLKGLAEIYLEQKDYEKSQSLAESCLVLAKRINSKREIKVASEILYEVYQAQNNYDKALEYHLIFTAYKDSIFNETMQKEINRLMLIREEALNEKLQKENELQKQKIKEKNIIATAIGLVSILLVLLAVVWYRASVRYKRISSSLFQRNIEVNQQKEEIETQAEELRKANLKISQINESLEEKVKERTAELEQQNKQLAEYAFINAHLLRGPLANIMGIVGLLEDSPRDESEQELVEILRTSTDKLNEVVHKINKAVQTGKHFGRDGIENGSLEKETNI